MVQPVTAAKWYAAILLQATKAIPLLLGIAPMLQVGLREAIVTRVNMFFRYLIGTIIAQ